MILLVFILLAILAIGIMAAEWKIYAKYAYNDEQNNTKFVSFVCEWDEAIDVTCGLVAIVSVIIAVLILFAAVTVQIAADGERAKLEQRYNALVYKARTESIRDEYGIINKEYIDEIQEWNEYIAKRQSYSHNIWIGIFYPKREYDGLEVIDLESIKMKN